VRPAAVTAARRAPHMGARCARAGAEPAVTGGRLGAQGPEGGCQPTAEAEGGAPGAGAGGVPLGPDTAEDAPAAEQGPMLGEWVSVLDKRQARGLGPSGMRML